MKIAIFDNDKATKFGKITHMVNLGESIVPEAVRQYLIQIGEDISDISTTQYFGNCHFDEPHRLLVTGHFGRQFEVAFMKNRNVMPIFISFAWKDFFLTREELSYFKSHEPILCRDEFTRNIMRRYGIEAYLFGCITLSIPTKKREQQGDKYYFVDVAERYLQIVPTSILRESVITSQNIKTENINNDVMCDLKKLAIDRLTEYKNNAKLIITPKLHCMTPCIAMGIPTIAIGDNFSYRYSYIDKFIKAYSYEEFKHYNWAGRYNKPDLQEVKQLQLDIGKDILRGEKNVELMQRLDSVFMKRNRWNYLKKMHEDIKQIEERTSSKEIIIWGASSGGYTVASCIKRDFPELNIAGIVDMYAKGMFAGKVIMQPEEALQKNPNASVIISTLSGMQYAKNYLDKMNRRYFVVHENM